MALFDNNILSGASLIGSSLLSLSGGLKAARGLEASARASEAAAAHNAGIVAANLNVELDVLSRDIRRLFSTQQTQVAFSGASVTSQSALALMSDSMSTFERQIVNARNAAQNEMNKIIYEGQLQAAAARTRARTQRASAFASFLSRVPTILGAFS